jgi:alpha-1,6-mannosyltransferase
MTGAAAGRAGMAATAASITATLAVGLAGPSAMEPALPAGPGGQGQPPWAFGLHLSPYLAISLAAAALAAGTAGLGLCLSALRRGWTVPPRAVLAAGLMSATAIALIPPFGSSDHLSYAAYGRMVVTGHNPYLTTPAMLAASGDPVARAVQDWRTSRSVYGSLATGGQALASWIGGDSARLTVFVLSLLGLAAFGGTGLLLHLLTRGSRPRQLRAGLVWTLNPLLLQVLVAGAHVDSQAIVFAVAAIAIFALGVPPAGAASPRGLGVAAGAGAVAGLAFAVKVSYVLVAAGLVVSALLAWWPRPGHGPGTGRWRPLAFAVGGLAGGFLVTAALAAVPWGLGSVDPALRAGSLVSIGSPWRAVRAGLHLLTGDPAANDLVKAGAIVLAVLLLALFARPLLALAAGPARLAPPGGPAPPGPAGLAMLAAACSFALAFAWLVAWPYVLPWYDGLAWALLALLPWAPLPPEPVPLALDRAALPWAVLDWLLLARTAALAFGYLPARGIALPAGLGWLQSVVRTGVTPVILLAVTVALIVVLCRAPGSVASTRS